MVPCPSHLASFILEASLSKTSIKVLPIIFRFFPVLYPGQTIQEQIPGFCSHYIQSQLFIILQYVFEFVFPHKPLSTKIQVRFSPTALCNNIAATVESTPPDKPKITRSVPSFSLNSFTVVSTKESGVQLCEQPQIFTTKFRNNHFPSVL